MEYVYSTRQVYINHLKARCPGYKLGWPYTAVYGCAGGQLKKKICCGLIGKS
jgi:hypothetical protein